jgi:hypothetical protein
MFSEATCLFKQECTAFFSHAKGYVAVLREGCCFKLRTNFRIALDISSSY